jgi:hypothetical protein
MHAWHCAGAGHPGPPCMQHTPPLVAPVRWVQASVAQRETTARRRLYRRRECLFRCARPCAAARGLGNACIRDHGAGTCAVASPTIYTRKQVVMVAAARCAKRTWQTWGSIAKVRGWMLDIRARQTTGARAHLMRDSGQERGQGSGDDDCGGGDAARRAAFLGRCPHGRHPCRPHGRNP